MELVPRGEGRLLREHQLSSPLPQGGEGISPIRTTWSRVEAVIRGLKSKAQEDRKRGTIRDGPGSDLRGLCFMPCSENLFNFCIT